MNKIINPTLDDLDMFFAKEVAKLDDATISFASGGPSWLDYTKNFESVLPFLQKWRTVKVDWDRISELWSVELGNSGQVWGQNPAMAATIALLREEGFSICYSS